MSAEWKDGGATHSLHIRGSIDVIASCSRAVLPARLHHSEKGPKRCRFSREFREVGVRLSPLWAAGAAGTQLIGERTDLRMESLS